MHEQEVGNAVWAMKESAAVKKALIGTHLLSVKDAVWVDFIKKNCIEQLIGRRDTIIVILISKSFSLPLYLPLSIYLILSLSLYDLLSLYPYLYLYLPVSMSLCLTLPFSFLFCHSISLSDNPTSTIAAMSLDPRKSGKGKSGINSLTFHIVQLATFRFWRIAFYYHMIFFDRFWYFSVSIFLPSLCLIFVSLLLLILILIFHLTFLVVRKSAFSSGTRQQPNSLLIGDTTGTTSVTTSALVTSSTEGGGGALVPITSSIESKVEAGDSLIADMAPSGACLHGHEDRYSHCNVFAIFVCWLNLLCHVMHTPCARLI